MNAVMDGSITDGRAQVEQRNYVHLVYDIAWFGLALAATSRFLSVYAIRLGATPFDLGLIAAIPSLMLLISSSFSTFWLHRFKSPHNALLLPGFGFRLLFLLPLFAPMVPERFQPLWLIFSVSLPAIAQGVCAVIFIVHMRQTVTPTRMGSLMGRRALALNICVAIGALAFGLLLEQVAFPLNYQIMFGVAFVCAMVSWWHVWKLRELPGQMAEAAPAVVEPAPAPAVKRPSPWRNPNFRSVAGVTGVLHLAMFAIVPVIPLFLVNRLDADEGFMAMLGMLELAAGAAMSIIAPRLIFRFGARAVMAGGMIVAGISALMYALATDLPITLLAGALSGGSWTAAASVGLMNYFMDRTPTGDTESYSTAFHQAIGLTMFIGPLLGSMLANNGVNLVTILLLGAGMRFIAALVLAPHKPRQRMGMRLPFGKRHERAVPHAS